MWGRAPSPVQSSEARLRFLCGSYIPVAFAQGSLSDLPFSENLLRLPFIYHF
jgi:hypothetical protein